MSFLNKNCSKLYYEMIGSKWEYTFKVHHCLHFMHFFQKIGITKYTELQGKFRKEEANKKQKNQPTENKQKANIIFLNVLLFLPVKNVLKGTLLWHKASNKLGFLNNKI